MEIVVVLALLAVFPVAALSALVDAMRRPPELFDQAGLSKTMTVAGVLLSGGVGGIYYWLVVRRRLSAANAR